MPSALSRDTNARASVVSANSLSGSRQAFTPLVRTPTWARFIVTSIFERSASREITPAERGHPRGRSITAHSMGSPFEDDRHPAQAPRLSLWLGSGAALRWPFGITIRRLLAV